MIRELCDGALSPSRHLGALRDKDAAASVDHGKKTPDAMSEDRFSTSVSALEYDVSF